MDYYSQLLTDYGYWGMFVASFIAGSVFPFSSEAIMIALMAMGLDPALLVAYATTGNVLGSMFNYWIGTFGRMEWIERWLRVKPEKIDRTEKFVQGKGAFAGVFCFVPVLGSVIAVVLGILRANVFITFLSIFIGKLLRYVVLAYCYVYGVKLF